MQRTDVLQGLGLSDKESKAYLALLELGQGSAYVVAKKSGLKQPTAYVVLEDLRNKGYVLKIPRPRKHLFIAKDPYEILEATNDRVRAFQDLIPELRALANSHKTGINTLFFDGYDGIKEAMWYRLDDLKDKNSVAFFGSGRDTSKQILDLVDDWNEEMLSRNVCIKAIAPSHDSLEKFRKLDKDYRRDVKIVPYDKYSSDISIDINEYFVRIIMFKDKQCVIIDNPGVAKVVTQIFTMLWDKL